MGQIVRKRKKGRPAKADLRAPDTSPKGRSLRRSHRRRNVRYVFDLDDYFDDEGLFEDDEDLRRRGKKLKLLLKVQSAETGLDDIPESTASQLGCDGRLQHPLSPSASSSYESDNPSKIRKIDEDMNEYIDDENGDNNEDEDEAPEENSKSKAEVLHSGKEFGAASRGLPLPDKKSLEMILDKIQKKDIYGVYAEPVDPEELPDYHDVIDNPMDFATIRNKLSSGVYETLDQFENDVFLICTNAMQYNAPDTIYHKQARSIQEMAKNKFYRIRLNFQSSEKNVKPEQKIWSSKNFNKQIKTSANCNVLDSVVNDFSSRATLGAAIHIQHVDNAFQAIESERPGNIDRLVEGNSLFNNSHLDKEDELLPGKSTLSRPFRKILSQDENRRGSYGMPLDQLLTCSESIFSTFEGESKQLVPVGLYSDHSYARSLARFAATLGPVAWRFASSRIEQALPQEFKFGRGWVGEFEPLPTPVLLVENCNVKEPAFFSKKNLAADPKNKENISSKETPGSTRLLNKKLPFLGPPGNSSFPSLPVKASSVGETVSEVKSSFFSPAGIKPHSSSNPIYQHQNSHSRNVPEFEKKGMKKVELNRSSSIGKNGSGSTETRQISKSPELECSRSMNINFSPPGSGKQADIQGVPIGGFPNGKNVSNRVDSSAVTSSSPDLVNGIGYYTPKQGQILTDPVHMMQMFAGKSQNQQKTANQSPADAPQFFSPPPNRNDSNNAAAAAARAWMSVGAGGFRPVGEMNPFKNQIHADSLYNSTRAMQSQASRFREVRPAYGMHLQLDKNSSSLDAFIPPGNPQPMKIGNSMQFQNQPMVFQPFANADLSKFQLQSTWRNITPQMHSRPQPESFPPDLNIVFQSTGSPGRPPSSVLVDSQQPDLALQL